MYYGKPVPFTSTSDRGPNLSPVLSRSLFSSLVSVEESTILLVLLNPSGSTWSIGHGVSPVGLQDKKEGLLKRSGKGHSSKFLRWVSTGCDSIKCKGTLVSHER